MICTDRECVLVIRELFRHSRMINIRIFHGARSEPTAWIVFILLVRVVSTNRNLQYPIDLIKEAPLLTTSKRPDFQGVNLSDIGRGGAASSSGGVALGINREPDDMVEDEDDFEEEKSVWSKYLKQVE